MKAITLAALSLLAACAAPPAVPSPSICPSVVTYTPVEEAEIYAALMALPSDSVLHKIADEDYHLRAELKACRGVP